MDRLWAPWRVKYLTEVIDKTKGCVFCDIAKSKEDQKNFVFVRRTHCYAVLNLYPYNNGHSMVLPYRHVNDLSKLTSEESQELFELLTYVKELLDETLSPNGYNIGINLGRVAGAGFPGHIHVHIVPRWKGDANFMPVVAGVKVISQSMKMLYGKLVKAHQKRIKKKTK
ncbi:MAG: HIT domain-containing protein [Candidatus Omnitrophica bacterium]|nr:HIT domain-containing protein [Candidatus Omnitrophota bacterium]